MRRRAFLEGSGALVVAWSASGAVTKLVAQGGGMNGRGSAQLDSWLTIGADGKVTAYTGKCELGHGLYTAQMQFAYAVWLVNRYFPSSCSRRRYCPCSSRATSRCSR